MPRRQDTWDRGLFRPSAVGAWRTAALPFGLRRHVGALELGDMSPSTLRSCFSLFISTSKIIKKCQKTSKTRFTFEVRPRKTGMLAPRRPSPLAPSVRFFSSTRGDQGRLGTTRPDFPRLVVGISSFGLLSDFGSRPSDLSASFVARKNPQKSPKIRKKQPSRPRIF